MSTADQTVYLREEIKSLSTAVEDVMNVLDHEMANIEFQDLVAIGDAISKSGDLMAFIAKQIKQTANERMKKAKVKTAIVAGLDGNQYVVEQVNTPTRTNVQKDDLLRDVERIAKAETRIDKETGEILPTEQILLEIIKTAFRLEPRWSEITKLGLDDDEYCSKGWNSTVKVTETENVL